MTEQEIKVLTHNQMYGNWISQQNTNGLEIQINITSTDVSLIIKKEGIEQENITFSSNAHWFESYLSFIDGQRFFIIYANEKEMQFGEQESRGLFNGKNKWVLKFDRTSK